MTTATQNKIPQLNIFGTIDKEKINLFDPPYAIRNDCSLGQWKVGEKGMLGDSLAISIIGVRNFYGKLGKGKPCDWLQLWFVAAPNEPKIPTNVVCVSYIKTRSKSALGQTLIEVMESTEPALGIFETGFEQHSNELGKYYSINWKWRERQPEEMNQLNLIADFLKTKPALIDTNLPDTMILIQGIEKEKELEEAKIEVKILIDKRQKLIEAAKS
jgi:hypothetical protein